MLSKCPLYYIGHVSEITIPWPCWLSKLHWLVNMSNIKQCLCALFSTCLMHVTPQLMMVYWWYLHWWKTINYWLSMLPTELNSKFRATYYRTLDIFQLHMYYTCIVIYNTCTRYTPALHMQFYTCNTCAGHIHVLYVWNMCMLGVLHFYYRCINDMWFKWGSIKLTIYVIKPDHHVCYRLVSL